MMVSEIRNKSKKLAEELDEFRVRFGEATEAVLINSLAIDSMTANNYDSSHYASSLAAIYDHLSIMYGELERFEIELKEMGKE